MDLRVVSAIPGRIRLHSPSARRAPGALLGIAEELQGRPEIGEVVVRSTSASVIVRYDPESTDHAALATALREVGISPAPLEHITATAATRQSAHAPLERAGRELNARVMRATDGQDLRSLLPLGLGLIALRQAVRGRGRLDDAPWYVVGWYAFDSFWKLRPPEPQAVRAAADDDR